MANRLVTYTKGYILALFRDGEWMYTKTREYERDKARLLSQLDARGIGLLTDELPAVAKHLNRCLDEGRFTNPHLTLTRSKCDGEEIPVFLREIFLRIFDKDGLLRSDPCAGAVLFLKTLLTSLKSVRVQCSQGAIENEVVNFFSTDANLRGPDLDWDLDDLVDGDISNSQRVRDLRFSDFVENRPLLGVQKDKLAVERLTNFERCAGIVASQLGLAPHLCGEHSDADSRPRHGPGVVADLPSGDSKYRTPHWPRKLQRVFPLDYYALPSFGRGFSRDREYPGEQEFPSRLIAVPKTRLKPRLIAAEPVAHQWIQQLLWQELRDRIASGPLSRAINFRRQDLSQDLVLRGSKDASNASIDLSEASDRLSCAVVERFFRSNPDWLDALHACRTRWVSYKSNTLSLATRLKKFAPMGSSVTFPLQTLVFATAAIAAVLKTKRLATTDANIRRYAHLVRVFGDDIIVPKDVLGEVTLLLEDLGLKVNTSKTFGGSNFRESCGCDAFQGVDVTPPKVLTVPSGRLGEVPSLVETSNNFHKKGFWYTSQYIATMFSRWHKMLPIERGTSLPVSLFSFTGLKTDHLTSKYDGNIQATKYRILKQEVKVVEARMRPCDRITQYFTERPDPLTKWSSGTAASRTVNTRPGWGLLYPTG